MKPQETEIEQEDQMTKITRNTTISISLGITLLVAVFWGASVYGAITERHRQFERELEAVKNTLDEQMPRPEIDTNLQNITSQLRDIKETQKQILLKLNE